MIKMFRPYKQYPSRDTAPFTEERIYNNLPCCPPWSTEGSAQAAGCGTAGWGSRS